MKPESGLESRTTSLGEAPGISSFATRPSSPVSQQGKTRHLLPTTHSMAGSGVIVGPGRMVHACTHPYPHTLRVSACAEAMCASLRDQLVSMALASAKALLETAGMVEQVGAEAGRWLMSFVSQVQLHRGARNLPTELPGIATLGWRGLIRPISWILYLGLRSRRGRDQGAGTLAWE